MWEWIKAAAALVLIGTQEELPPIMVFRWVCYWRFFEGVLKWFDLNPEKWVKRFLDEVEWLWSNMMKGIKRWWRYKVKKYKKPGRKINEEERIVSK